MTKPKFEIGEIVKYNSHLREVKNIFSKDNKEFSYTLDYVEGGNSTDRKFVEEQSILATGYKRCNPEEISTFEVEDRVKSKRAIMTTNRQFPAGQIGTVLTTKKPWITVSGFNSNGTNILLQEDLFELLKEDELVPPKSEVKPPKGSNPSSIRFSMVEVD